MEYVDELSEITKTTEYIKYRYAKRDTLQLNYNVSEL